MKEKVDSGTIRKYLSGQYSFRDLKRIASWFSDIRYQEELKSLVESHWFEFEGGAQKDLSGVFNRLKQQILEEKAKLRFTQKFTRFYAKAAAILLVPLLIYSSFSLVSLFYNNQKSVTWVEIVSPNATRTHFDLPDGTKVSLNSGAHLKYNVDFKQNRHLVLDGEAYFDVFHDASSPFIVQTDVVDVKVLGTKFSLAAIKGENSVEVILEEGKVQLNGKGNSFSGILNSDERFFYDRKNQKGKIEKVDAKYLTSWKDGLLMFRSEPLGEVMKRIGRWYNVKFEIADPEVEAFRYRATFGDEPLEEVLRLISLTAPVKYEIKERSMTKDGKYNDKIVVVRLKK